MFIYQDASDPKPKNAPWRQWVVIHERGQVLITQPLKGSLRASGPVGADRPRESLADGTEASHKASCRQNARVPAPRRLPRACTRCEVGLIYPTGAICKAQDQSLIGRVPAGPSYPTNSSSRSLRSFAYSFEKANSPSAKRKRSCSSSWTNSEDQPASLKSISYLCRGPRLALRRHILLPGRSHTREVYGARCRTLPQD